MKRAELKLVEAKRPVTVDITALLRADIPDAEHWRASHIRGDRNPPIELDERPKRGWLA